MTAPRTDPSRPEDPTSERAPDSAVPLLRWDNVTLGYAGRTILGPLTLRLMPGDRIVVTGDNGSGKSTLLAAFAGLLHPDTRRPRNEPPPPEHEPPRTNGPRIGYLGHDEPCYPELTLRENLRLHASLRGIGPAAVSWWLENVGLGETADTPYQAASRGMRRRLGLAIACISDPTLLFIDEPETGMDDGARTVLGEVLRARATPDKATVVATHRAAALDAWATTRWHITDGRIVTNLKANPAETSTGPPPHDNAAEDAARAR